MRQRIGIGVVVGVFVEALSAAGQSTVEGMLTINGETVALKHGYVYYHMNEEKVLDSQEIRILLTDNEVPAEYLSRPYPSKYDALARAGAFKGVYLSYNPLADEREVHGTIYFAPTEPGMSMPFFTLAGDGAGFVSLSLMGSTYEAEVANSNPESQFEDMPTYEYAAYFTATVAEGPELSASHEGAAGLNTPQAEAALGFEKAVRAGDLAGAKALCTEARVKELEKFIAQAGEDVFKQQVAAFIPEPEVRAK